MQGGHTGVSGLSIVAAEHIVLAMPASLNQVLGKSGQGASENSPPHMHGPRAAPERVQKWSGKFRAVQTCMQCRAHSAVILRL